MSEVKTLVADGAGKLPDSKLPSTAARLADVAGKLTKPTTPGAAAAVTLAADGTVSTTPLSGLATTTDLGAKLAKPSTPGAAAAVTIAADGTVATTPLSGLATTTDLGAKLTKPSNPAAPAAVTIAADGTVSTTLLSGLGGGGGGATLNPRGAYAVSTVYAVGDSFTYEGTAWVVLVAHTAGATPDETKAKQYGVDPASAVQIVVQNTPTWAAALITTDTDGNPGRLPISVGTFVPDDGGPPPEGDWTTTLITRHRGPFDIAAADSLPATIGGNPLVATNTGGAGGPERNTVVDDVIDGLAFRGLASKYVVTLPTSVPLDPTDGKFSYVTVLFRRLLATAGADWLGIISLNGASLYAQYNSGAGSLTFHCGDGTGVVSGSALEVSAGYAVPGIAGTLTSILGNGWHVATVAFKGNVGFCRLDNTDLFSGIDTTGSPAATTAGLDPITGNGGAWRAAIEFDDFLVGTGATAAQIRQMHTDLLAGAPA